VQDDEPENERQAAPNEQEPHQVPCGRMSGHPSVSKRKPRQPERHEAVKQQQPEGLQNRRPRRKVVTKCGIVLRHNVPYRSPRQEVKKRDSTCCVSGVSLALLLEPLGGVVDNARAGYAAGSYAVARSEPRPPGAMVIRAGSSAAMRKIPQIQGSRRNVRKPLDWSRSTI